MKPLEDVLAEQRPHIDGADRFSARQRLLFAAVSEPSARGCAEVELLVRSLRAFGGRQSDADFRVFFVGEVPEVAGRRLRRLGVDLRVSQRFDEDCPHANKLAMFREADGCDYLLGVDTDTVVVGDLTAQLFGGSVGGRPASLDPYGGAAWESVLNAFDLPVPADRYVSTLMRTELPVPYFNSGVMLVPAELAGWLHDAWGRWVRRVIDGWARVPELAAQKFYTDQIALALALVAEGLPRRALPLAVNMSFHSAHEALGPEVVEPLVLHHHHRLGAEGLALGVHAGWNDAVVRVNEAVDVGAVVGAYGLAAVDERSVEGVSR